MDKSKDKKTAKKLATGALVIATAIGASAASDTPVSYDDINNQTAVVQDIGDMGATVDVAADEATVEDEEKQKKRATLGSVIMAPLYFAGMGILKLFELIAAGWSIPVVGSIIRWALFTLLVIGTIAAGLKVAFPNVSLRKLMTPRRIGTIALGTTVISVACAVLPMFGADAAAWASWIRLAGGVLLVAPAAYVIITFRKRINKKFA